MINFVTQSQPASAIFQAMRIIEIDSLQNEGMGMFRSLTEAQLRNRLYHVERIIEIGNSAGKRRRLAYKGNNTRGRFHGSHTYIKTSLLPLMLQQLMQLPLGN